MTGRVAALASDPGDLDAATRAGAFEALRRSVRDLGATGTIATLASSGLRGRGGAGFPTGEKWRAAAGQPATQRYVVANGYGADPAVRTDATLMANDPWVVIEGLTIAAFAVGATEAIIAVRAEDTSLITLLEGAVLAAEEAGFLGDDVMGSGHRVTVTVRPVQGAYMLGEETVLLKALEGKRGQPEQRPPYPTEKGLFDKPTVVNNVQTLASVPWIVREGGAAYASIGSTVQPGHDPRPAPRPRGRGHRRGPARHAAHRARAPGGRDRQAQPQGAARRRADRRPAPRGPPGHAVRVRRAARGRGAHRLRVRRHRGRPGVRRGPRPPAHEVLRRRGVRQDDPLPHRPAPAVRDRRPRRERPSEAHGHDADGRPRRRRRGLRRCATTSAWRPFRSPAGCDTSGPSSTTTSSAAPVPPGSVTPSRSVRRHRDPADGRPHRSPRHRRAARAARRASRPARRLRHGHAPRGQRRRAPDHDAVPAAAAEHAADPHRGGRPGRRGLRGADDPRGLPRQRHRDPDAVLRAQAAGLRCLPDVRVRGRGRGPAADLLLPRGRGGHGRPHPDRRAAPDPAGRTSS